MEADKLDKIKKSIESTISSVFHFIVGIVDVCVTIVLLFGACAAILLLYKMFPDIALIIMKPMGVVLLIISKIITVAFILLLVLLYGYIAVLFGISMKKARNRRDLKRKKFMNDLVKKLKMEIKNK